ncbi:MAG TPA: ATP-dependent sacrificial sulfur transferase LarE [Abditibacteriaceae bacterium]|nr:ATP-dependent sacrificial sulfur transferase LarE [Abditibacteriaceae bacterium]
MQTDITFISSQPRPAVLDAVLEEKLDALRALLRGLGRVIIAYSGGVDSAFLLKIAHQELDERAVAIIGISPSLMPEEYAEAGELAAQLEIPLRAVATHEMDDPNYVANPNNRCYFCKSELFDVLTRIARDENFDAVCDGTNVDDLKEWRPGAQAGAEHAVRSPLREVGLAKAEIRTLSRTLGLPTWDKPAMPCLSSRIPYGTPVTVEALQMIGRAEAWLRSHGLREVRVRHYVEKERPTARIEVDPGEMPVLFALREEAAQELRRLGYAAILLDLEGYRRGKLNDAVTSSGSRPTAQVIELH